MGAAVMTLLTLGGCASGQMDRNAAFTKSSPTSLVMFGVDLRSQFKMPDFAFRKYDPVTGRVEHSETYHATPTLDQITGGQKLATYLAGGDARPVGHVYFTISLPPGEWFLWRVSAAHALGLDRWRLTTTALSGGTVLISSKPGAALYLGEFVLKGKYSEDITLTLAPRDLAAAQAQLDTFSGVQVKLVDDETPVGSFKCLKGRLERRECEPTEIVLPP
jgi:hypothetical protein